MEKKVGGGVSAERERVRGQWAVYKYYNNVFLFVGLTTLGTLVNFDWLAHEVEYSNVSTTNCNLRKD